MHPYLLPGLELSPRAFQRLTAQIPAGRYDETTDPDRFTFREAIAHLADWEPIFLARIEAGVKENGAAIFGIDESKRAAEQGYENWDVHESLEKFRAAREKTVAYLKAMSPQDWESTVVHNEKGAMTAYDQANMLLGHDIYHFEHACQFLGPRTAGTW